MLTFLAIAVGLMGLWGLINAGRPLVERDVVTAEDWARLEDESLALLERRDLLIAELRDLEFEASLNKIGDQDLAELKARYEAEAVALITRLDERAAVYEDRIEAEVVARLGGGPAPEPLLESAPEPASEEAVEAMSCAGCAAPLPADARFCDACGAPVEATAPCPSCDTHNRADARFCKGCGGALGEGES